LILIPYFLEKKDCLPVSQHNDLHMSAEIRNILIEIFNQLIGQIGGVCRAFEYIENKVIEVSQAF
jgi:hypothetical protein